jgi:hypothetical protein
MFAYKRNILLEICLHRPVSDLLGILFCFAYQFEIGEDEL